MLKWIIIINIILNSIFSIHTNTYSNANTETEIWKYSNFDNKVLLCQYNYNDVENTNDVLFFYHKYYENLKNYNRLLDGYKKYEKIEEYQEFLQIESIDTSGIISIFYIDIDNDSELDCCQFRLVNDLEFFQNIALTGEENIVIKKYNKIVFDICKFFNGGLHLVDSIDICILDDDNDFFEFNAMIKNTDSQPNIYMRCGNYTGPIFDGYFSNLYKIKYDTTVNKLKIAMISHIGGSVYGFDDIFEGNEKDGIKNGDFTDWENGDNGHLFSIKRTSNLNKDIDRRGISNIEYYEKLLEPIVTTITSWVDNKILD